jgi:YD repeat-containing protein
MPTARGGRHACSLLKRTLRGDGEIRAAENEESWRVENHITGPSVRRLSGRPSGVPLRRVFGHAGVGMRIQARSNLIQTTDAQGMSTRFRYDAANTVISTTIGITTTSPLRATTLYTYTAGSRLLEQRGRDGVVMCNGYDAQGKVISTTIGYGTPLRQTTIYGYDALSRVVTTTVGYGTPLARSDVTRLNADNTVNQTIQNYQDGVFAANQPDADILTSYGYDHLGRTVAVTDTLGHVDVSHYGAQGRVDWTARNAAPTQLDADGLPISHAYSPTTPDHDVATLYGYDGLGRSALITETGILTETFNPTTRTEYDALSRPMTVTLNYRPGLPANADTNIQLYTRYDGAGNVITQTDAFLSAILRESQ